MSLFNENQPDLIWLVIPVVIGLVGCGSSPESGFAPEEGTTYDYTSTYESHIEFDRSDGLFSMDDRGIEDGELRVVDRDGGTTTLVYDMERFRLRYSDDFKRSYGDYDLDTNDPAVWERIENSSDTSISFLGFVVHAGLTEEPFRVDVNRRGRLARLTGYDSVLEQALTRIDFPDECFECRARSYFRTYYQEKRMKQYLNNFLHHLPPSSDTETWQYRHRMNLPYSVRIKNRYQYETKTDTRHVIEFQGDIKPYNTHQTTSWNGIVWSDVLRGEQEGRVVYDPEEDMIKRVRIRRDMTGQQNYYSGPFSFLGPSDTIPMTVQDTMTLLVSSTDQN